MADTNFEANDEVFNLLTRKVGTVINVKEISSSLSSSHEKIRESLYQARHSG